MNKAFWIAVVFSLLLVPPVFSASYTECRENACAIITVPDSVNPGEPFVISVEGYLETTSRWEVTSYSFYENAQWAYDDAGLVRSDSDALDIKGFNWGGHVARTYPMALEPGDYTYTFVFGYRGWGHGYYDVAVEATLTVAPQVLEVAFDVKPQSCPNPMNVNQKGVLSAALVGTEALDVTLVDIETLTMDGVSPIHFAFEDVTTPYLPLSGKENEYDCVDFGPDGITDLVLKFKTQDVFEAIEASQERTLKDREIIVTTIRGEILNSDATRIPIVGEDVLRILRKK